MESSCRQELKTELSAGVVEYREGGSLLFLDLLFGVCPVDN